MFKVKRKPKSLRRHRASDVDEKAEEETEQLELLRELREEQKDRRRSSGLESKKLMNASEKAIQEKQRKLEEDLRGIQEQAAGPDLKALMTSQFTEQTLASQADDKVHEKRMEAFIDEKMGVVQEEEVKVKVLSEEDKLYVVKDAGSAVIDQSEGSTGNAAPLFMNTGLAEVSLPIDFRLKNIKRTEEAQAVLQAKRDGIYRRREGTSRGGGVRADSGPSSSGRYGGTAALAGGSFNSNFNTHRREWAVMMKAKDREGGGTEGKGGHNSSELFDGTCNTCGKSGHRSRDCPSGSRGGGQHINSRSHQSGGQPIGRSAMSSDDRCFEQYKKRARR